MKFAPAILLASYASITVAAASTEVATNLAERDVIGSSCNTPYVSSQGTCQTTAQCHEDSLLSVPGYCPGTPNDVQCCVRIACSTPHGDGNCMNENDGACVDGEYIANFCPGPNNFKCCVSSASVGSNTTSTTTTTTTGPSTSTSTPVSGASSYSGTPSVSSNSTGPTVLPSNATWGTPTATSSPQPVANGGLGVRYKLRDWGLATLSSTELCLISLVAMNFVV